jgi:hypothetical protein
LSREDEIMRALPEIVLTPEQAEEAERIEDILSAKATVRYLAQLMASKGNGQLFGETEYLMRDAVHRLGAEGIDIALHERKKRFNALFGGMAGKYGHAGFHWRLCLAARQTRGERSMSAEALYEAMGLWRAMKSRGRGRTTGRLLCRLWCRVTRWPVGSAGVGGCILTSGRGGSGSRLRWGSRRW